MLTNAQLQTLKAAINADPTFAAMPNTTANAMTIADALNLEASPDFWVWKKRLSTAEVYDAIVWTELIGRSQGERDTLQIMLSQGFIDPSLANTRQGFQDIFSGAAGAVTRSQLTAASRRKATRFERIFATGTGSTGSPGSLVVEGPVSYAEVESARAV